VLLGKLCNDIRRPRTMSLIAPEYGHSIDSLISNSCCGVRGRGQRGAYAWPVIKQARLNEAPADWTIVITDKGFDPEFAGTALRTP